MKNIFVAITCTLLLLLGGCSTMTPSEFVSPTQAIVESTNEQAMVTSCLQWVKEKEAKELESYNGLASTDKAMALMHRETMGMIKGVWGKGNECKPGTNVWDAYQVYVQQTEETKRKISGDVKSVATVGVVTGGAVKLVDSFMGAAGDRINTTGDNSGVQKTTTNTTTNTNTASTNVGEGQSSANGGVSSPAAPGSTTKVDPKHWQDCTTLSTGAATVDETNACMQKDYGYNTEVKDGQLYLDGKPFSGV